LPATLFIPNGWVKIIILVAEGLSFVALFCNSRLGRPLLTGMIVVVTCEVGLIGVIYTTNPFDTVNLPLFDLFAMAVLLAVSLLPPRFVFGVAALNSVFILYMLLLRPHTPPLDHFLMSQFYNAAIRPIALQWIVACIGFIWVHSTNEFIVKIYALQTNLYVLSDQLVAQSDRDSQGQHVVIDSEHQCEEE
jgi:hypothetical protein